MKGVGGGVTHACVVSASDMTFHAFSSEGKREGTVRSSGNLAFS
jgi:hypothetical protein